MYQFLLFLHVSSVIAFLLFHGATASVTFALKREREPKRVEGLLAVRDWAERLWGWPLMVLLITGIAMGIIGRWWGQAWIWISVGLFIAIGIVHGVTGRRYIERIWHAIDPVGHTSPVKEEARNPHPASAKELAELLESGRPIFLTVVGVGGIAVILWMMMFKPF